MAQSWIVSHGVASEIDRLQRRTNRLLSWMPRRLAPAAREFPLINVALMGDAIVVRAELPGILLEQISVSITGSSLTLQGARKPETEIAPESYQRRERRSGKFTRIIELPERVTAEAVKATYRDGILEIHAPVAPKNEPRRIEIQPQ